MPTNAASENEGGHRVWPLVSRIAAAALGGYALANALSVAIMGALFDSRAIATMAAMELSFLIHAVAVMWAFSVRSVRVVWLGLLVPTMLAAIFAAWIV